MVENSKEVVVVASGGVGLEYWLQWQVLICALIFILPMAISVNLLIKKKARRDHDNQLKPADLWTSCWRNLHPRWLLFYRAFAFASMSFLLFQTVSTIGFFSFFFYTQWTFALVLVYFAIATIISIQGCRIHAPNPFPKHNGEQLKFLKEDSEDIAKDGKSSSTSRLEKIARKGFVKLEFDHNRTTPDNTEGLGFLQQLLHILYQTCAGAVVLTDIVFWCLLLPFMTGDNFKLTVLIGLMHSVNAVFLLLESAMNRLPFSWFGLVYFVLLGCSYIVFQWLLHACCFTWWPYPFLDLSTPSAPLWYLGLALVHIPCYWLYMLVVKANNAAFSKMFPHSFVRSSIEKKQV